MQRCGVSQCASTCHAAFAERRFPQLHDPAWLYHRYIEQGCSSAVIAAEVGCNSNSVLRALRTVGVPTRSGHVRRRFPALYDEHRVRRRYARKFATTRDIAAKLGCSKTSAEKALQRFGIPVRGGRSFPRLKSRAWLRRAYVTAGATVEQTALEVGCRPLTRERLTLPSSASPTPVRGRTQLGLPCRLGGAKGHRRVAQTRARPNSPIHVGSDPHATAIARRTAGFLQAELARFIASTRLDGAPVRDAQERR